jgi:hypothetical protein
MSNHQQRSWGHDLQKHVWSGLRSKIHLLDIRVPYRVVYRCKSYYYLGNAEPCIFAGFCKGYILIQLQLASTRTNEVNDPVRRKQSIYRYSDQWLGTQVEGKVAVHAWKTSLRQRYPTSWQTGSDRFIRQNFPFQRV